MSCQRASRTAVAGPLVRELMDHNVRSIDTIANPEVRRVHRPRLRLQREADLHEVDNPAGLVEWIRPELLGEEAQRLRLARQ